VSGALEIDGLLHITGEFGERIDLLGEGSRLRAEIGSSRVRRPTLRLLRSSVVFANRLAGVLARQDLTLVVTRRGKPLVELGAGVRGGIAERFLRMPRVRIFRRM
jgi:hypothetical protein